MEYQMFTYFDKLTFSSVLILQVVFYLSSPFCQNVNFHFYLPKSSTPHCQIVNYTMWILHYQLAKFTFFSSYPNLFQTDLLKKISILPNV
jgi:hypothetical protein